MSEKKATDVLTEIDTKVDLILKYITNIDFNIKRSSNKSNDQTVITNIIPPITPDYVVLDTSEMSFPEVTPESINSEEVKDDIKKVTIHQKVCYPNDKPAVLAKVKIFNSVKKEIKETKTNHSGKWNAVLEPGKYFIHITKAEVADKPKIDHYFEIVVQASKIPIELESRK